ncbi:MAG: hypothetical protein MJK12_02280 [Colwellia sp.]|nr:hypothetical protein [Colwellia sp.]
MPEREQIHQYLKDLSKYLSRLDKFNADEVIREIESHILDAIELQEQNGHQIDAQAILDGFGEPRALANQYVEHMLKGTAPPRGFKAIQSVKKGVTKSLYYSMGLFGFGISLFLILIGLGKLFMPDAIGVWSAAQGNSVIITFSEHAYPNSTELLGYWLIPIAIVIGIGTALLTKRVLAVLKQSLL